MTLVTASANHETDAVPVERLADGSIRFELKSGFWSRQIVTLTPVELVVRSEGLFRSSEHRFPVDAVTGFGFRRIDDGEGGDWTGLAFEAGGKTRRIGWNLDRRLVQAPVKAMGDVAPTLIALSQGNWQSIGSRARFVCSPQGTRVDISPLLTRNDLAVSIGFGVILFMVLFVALIQVLAVFLSATTLADARFDQLAAIGIFAFAMTAGVFWCVGIGKRERLRIGPSEIRVARSWMGIPWRQTTVAVENISQIKLLPNDDADGLVSAIALDANGQSWRFGKDLSLIEANGIIDEMVKVAPELGRVTRGLQPPAP